MGLKVGAPHPKFIWQSQYKREIQRLSAFQKVVSPFSDDVCPFYGVVSFLIIIIIVYIIIWLYYKY